MGHVTKKPTRGWPRIPFRSAAVCECGDHGFVGLTKGAVAFFSPDRVGDVWPHRWHFARSSSGYARTTDKLGKNVFMHRMLVSGEGEVVDHINRDGLDNRSENLRACSQRQNLQNSKKNPSRSIFKGIAVHRGGTVTACIRVDGKTRHLGTFASELDAAVAYDDAALRLYGEFALTNKMLGLL